MPTGTVKWFNDSKGFEHPLYVVPSLPDSRSVAADFLLPFLNASMRAPLTSFLVP